MRCRLQKVLYITVLVLMIQGLSACQRVSDEPDTPLASNTVDSKSRPVITDDWAIRLKPDTDPRVLAQEYGAVYLGSVGSLQDTWLIRRADFNMPDNQDPLRQDSRVLWLERQLKRKVYKRPPN